MHPEINRLRRLGTHFTCFTGTKVQILTQKALLGIPRTAELYNSLVPPPGYVAGISFFCHFLGAEYTLVQQ